MSTDTKVLPQSALNDNKNINDKNNEDNISCTPRNALFCCSSPVCLNLSTAPKILPIDYHYQQTVDNDIITPITTSVTTINSNDALMNNGEQAEINNIPLSVPDLAKMNAMTNTNGIIINGDATNENEQHNENETKRDRRKIRTPPAPNEKLGVVLKKVTPPKTKITVKQNEGPLLGVVLRKVEKKVEPIKSILDDDKPLYHLTVVRNGDNSKSSGKSKPVEPKKSTTSTGANAKKSVHANNNKNALINKKPTNTATTNQVNKKPPSATAQPKHQPRMPITVQKIEGDKIIIIKKIPVPKNGKLPPHLSHLSQLQQNRISTYDFPQYCENDKSLNQIGITIVPDPMSISYSSNECIKSSFPPHGHQVKEDVGGGDGKVNILPNHGEIESRSTNITSMRATKINDLKQQQQYKLPEVMSLNIITKELSSGSSLSSSSSPSTSISPPLTNIQWRNNKKQISKVSINSSSDSLKNLTNIDKFPSDKQKVCFENSKPPDKVAQETGKQKKTETNDFYSAEIDYMNNYLKSLPDYNELDKKIHKEFQKCEDLYDQIKSINNGMTAQKEAISKSYSQHNLPNQPTSNFKDSATVINSTKNKNMSTKQSSNLAAQSLFKYPSVFSEPTKNKLTRSISSTNMPGTQKFPIDHPEIPGFLPKAEQNVKSNQVKGIKKSSSNSCIIRPTGKQLMNEFWSENVEKNAKKSTWNYEKIMANPAPINSRGGSAKKTFLANTETQEKQNKLNSLCLSQLDNKIRQNVSREELYKIICNDKKNSNNSKPESQPVGKNSHKIISNKVDLVKDVENIPGFMNLNKSVSLSSMPGYLKSSTSKSHIPCYQKPFAALNKSSSNSQILPKQMNSNQMPVTYNCIATVPKLEYQQQLCSQNGVLKSSSSSCVFSNKNQYQPFYLKNQKRDIPVQLLDKNAQLDFRNIYNLNDSISKVNDAHKTVYKNQQQQIKLEPNATIKKFQERSNENQKVCNNFTDTSRIPRDQNNYHRPHHNIPMHPKKPRGNIPQVTCANVEMPVSSVQLQNSTCFAKTNLVANMTTKSSSSSDLSPKQPSNFNYQALIKAVTNTNWEISKKQKDAENNIEKCLNDMFRITSNYSQTPQVPIQKQHSKTQQINYVSGDNYNGITATAQKVVGKPLPLGKSNSTSSIYQLHHSNQARLNQLRNKKPITNLNNPNLSEAQNYNLIKFASSSSPVQAENIKTSKQNYSNIQPQSTSQQFLNGAGQEPVKSISFSKNLNKKSDSNNLYRKCENKTIASIPTTMVPANRYVSGSYIAGPTPPTQSSIVSSSNLSYPIRRCKKNSVGQTANATSTRQALKQDSTIDYTAENGPYCNEQTQSDILKTFDPYFYHSQPSTFTTSQQNQLPTKCVAAMSVTNKYIEQKQSLINQQQQPQCVIRTDSSAGRFSQNLSNNHPLDVSTGPLLGYEFPPPIPKVQTSSCFEKLIDSCTVSKTSENYTEQPKPPIQDDADGHLIYHTGDILHNRYKIMATLGEGTFGRVVKVKDMERDHCMALKIIKNVEKYREAAKLEIHALEKISQKDPNCDHLCVRMLDWFDYHGHMCIAFEMLGLSVFDFLRENNYEPYPLEQVRHMAYQLCYSVKFLHDNRLTHTDLKPENILFVDSEYTTHYNHKKNREVRRVKCTDVRLIDFGSATFDHEHHSTIVSTRHYRAPEVILELGWSQPCDVWSIGCILFELYLGITLFQTHDNREHLAMMERILGQIPYRMARKTKTKYFYHGKLDWDEKSSAGRYVRDHCKPLFRYLMSDSEDHMQLFDLIKKMLEYEPSQRITLGEALRHPFFDKLPPHHRIGEDMNNKITSGSSSRERSHSLSR